MIQKELNSVIRTDSGNNYFLSRSRLGVLFLHPVLKYLITLQEQGKLDEWIDGLMAEESNQIKIEKNLFVSKDTVLYYHRYLSFLEEKGLFDGVEKYPMLRNRYNSEDIQKSLANSRQIVFEVTQSCNLNCKYCGYGDFYDGYDKREDKKLDINTARKLIDYMINLWESPLNRQYFKKIPISFYGGEPLLNISLIEEIVGYVKGKSLSHNNFYFSMTTNGVLLDKYMEFLVANDFDVTISLDGNKENNAYRNFADGSSSFEKIYSNILKIKERYPEFFKKSVHFISVIHDKNSSKEVKEFFEREFEKESHMVEVNSIGIKPTNKADFKKLFKSVYSDFEDKDLKGTTINRKKLLKTPFFPQLWSFLRGRSGFVFTQYDYLIRKLKNPWVVSTGTCNPFSRKIFVTANGKILPCERILQVYSLGSVDHTGVHLDFEAVAAKVNEYFGKLMSQCNRCTNSDVCSNCIYNYNLNDELTTCTSIMDEEKFLENLRLQLSTLEDTRQYYPEIIKNYKVN